MAKHRIRKQRNLKRQPLVPCEFEEQHYSKGGSETPTPLNRDYYATQDTAKALMVRFGAARVAQVPTAYSAPPAAQAWLVWPDDIAVNAGMLAKQFVLNKEHPEVAQLNCEYLIAAVRAAGIHLPANS